jgi:hypothetical protein
LRCRRAAGPKRPSRDGQSAEKTQQKQQHCADTAAAAITRIVGKLKKLSTEQLLTFEKAIPDA